MEFGFSYVGLIYLIMLMVPNIIWSRNLPEGYTEYAGNEDRRLLIMERIGEVSVSCIVLIFSDFNIRTDSPWCIWLLVSFVLMVMYELYWMRYFRSPRAMADMYCPFMGIPVAGATLPVIAFGLLAVYGLNPILGVAVIVLGIGHLGIHVNHMREIE